jgi:hypothetical protein
MADLVTDIPDQEEAVVETLVVQGQVEHGSSNLVQKAVSGRVSARSLKSLNASVAEVGGGKQRRQGEGGEGREGRKGVGPP